MAKEYSPFVFATGITSNLIDELGHANYNSLKEVFEIARHRLCKHLGFGRKVLREHLQLGLFMSSDSYEYRQVLKLHDLIFFIPKIVVDSPARIIITFRVLRLYCKERGDEMTLTNSATYHMVMVNLKTQKPTRIPKSIIRSIERWQEERKILMGG